MKILVYKINQANNNKKSEKKIDFEKILLLSFIIMFSLLIITQTALLTPGIKAFITINSEYKGTLLGSEEFLFEKGEISLELQNIDSDDKLKVLINGEVIGAFINKTMIIKVKDGDVIELDGSEINNFDEIKIISLSENINPDILGKKLMIRSGIKKLTTIIIK